MAIFEVIFDGEGRVIRVEERPSQTLIEQGKNIKGYKDLITFIRTKSPAGFMADDLIVFGLIRDIDTNPALTKDQKNALVLKLTEKTPLDQLVLRTEAAPPDERDLFANKVISGAGLRGSYKLLDYFIDP